MQNRIRVSYQLTFPPCVSGKRAPTNDARPHDETVETRWAFQEDLEPRWNSQAKLIMWYGLSVYESIMWYLTIDHLTQCDIRITIAYVSIYNQYCVYIYIAYVYIYIYNICICHRLFYQHLLLTRLKKLIPTVWNVPFDSAICFPSCPGGQRTVYIWNLESNTPEDERLEPGHLDIHPWLQGKSSEPNPNHHFHVLSTNLRGWCRSSIHNHPSTNYKIAAATTTTS